MVGSPILFGVESFLLEVVVWKDNDQTKFIVGIAIKDLSISELIEKVLGKKLTIAWIGDMNAGKNIMLCFQLKLKATFLLLPETLREQCPNTEFFLVRHFPVFGLNTEIYCSSERYRLTLNHQK